MRVTMCVRRNFRAENDLRETFPIPQVHKNQAAVIAAVLYPAHEADLAAVVGQREGTAVMAALPVAQRTDIAGMLFLNVCRGFLIVQYLIAVAHILCPSHR